MEATYRTNDNATLYGDGLVNISSGGMIQFITCNSNVGCIDKTGNFGINNSNPTFTLDVLGTINASSNLLLGGSPIVSSQWINKTGSNVLYTINSNVGIRTSNPLYELDVTGTINATSNLLLGGVPIVSSQWINKTGSNVLYTINSNVGIRTSNPTFTLDVTGTINASSNLLLAGVPIVSSQWINLNGSNTLYTINSNVGIRTSNPTYALDVVGDVNYTGTFRKSGIPLLQMYTVAATTNQVVQNTSNLSFTTSSGSITNFAYNATGCNFIYTGTPAMMTANVYQFWTNVSNGSTGNIGLVMRRSGLSSNMSTFALNSAAGISFVITSNDILSLTNNAGSTLTYYNGTKVVFTMYGTQTTSL